MQNAILNQNIRRSIYQNRSIRTAIYLNIFDGSTLHIVQLNTMFYKLICNNVHILNGNIFLLCNSN